MLPDDWTNVQQGRKLSQEQAQALEQGLARMSDDRAARLQLIGYYSLTDITSPRRFAHLEWLVNHSPDSDLWTWPECNVDESITPDKQLQRFRNLWLEQAQGYPDCFWQIKIRPVWQPKIRPLEDWSSVCTVGHS